jgi:hypothetical protein
VTIEEIVEREVLGEASRACDLLIERVRSRVAAPSPQAVVELSVFAAAALEAYYDTLLRALLAAASRRDAGDTENWIRRRFHEGLDRASTALREAVADSPHRHSVAQKLQQKMFEGEVTLRRAMARFAETGATLGANVTPASESQFERRKAAG